MKQANFLDYDPDDIDVQIADLIVATHESADPLTHPKVSEGLEILRERLHMDVVFVSQFADNRRTFKVVSRSDKFTKVVAGQSDPLEETWCQRVVQERLPEYIRDARPLVEDGTAPDPGFAIGTHISTPITLLNGQVYGTLCCFSQAVARGTREIDLRRLQIAANLLGQELSSAGVGEELQLQPKDDGATRY